MKCPICGKPQDLKFRPFCSKKCADVDLARWFREDYKLPAVDDVVPEDSENSDPDDSEA